jgi:putative ABC transport system permease protein
MKFRDVFSQAYHTVRSNKLRTGLTVAIIAFGIMALVCIITAIDATKQKFSESFSTMGANGFTIRFKDRTIRFGGGNNQQGDVTLSKKGSKKEKKSNLGKRITKDEAELFVKYYHYPATTSISIFGSRNAIISRESKKTSPNILMYGGDENYILLNGFTLAEGRNINNMEVHSGTNVCLLGFDVAKRLFPEGSGGKVANSEVRINSVPYRVLGVLASRGSTFGFNRDNMVIIGYSNLERNFPSSSSYTIGVRTDDIRQVNEALGEADATFRPIRKLTTTEEDNFVLDRSDSVVEKAMNSIGFLTISLGVIGFITLIGAAIGLMNIMLVSVTERTKEVGLIKAIGGKSSNVRLQFLLEAVIISVLGALFGIILGVLLGNLFASFLGTGFVVPWDWVVASIIICSLVGLGAGLYPALKAGRLNPIEALRYE